MQKINPLIGNINFGVKKDNARKQSFSSFNVQNFAPLPVYTQVPYGINQRNYIKLGVEKLPNNQELHLYKLSNGQNVEILKTTKGNASIYTSVGVGAMDEEGFPKGISHFVEHSVFHGSEKYNCDLMKEIDKIATFDNASTTIQDTSYYADLAGDSIEDIAKALDIYSDMLLKPRFSGIEKEKPIVCAEYQNDVKNEERKVLEQSLSGLFPQIDKDAFLITGNNESINSITMDDMLRFHQKYYQPFNMNTLIATKNNPDEIINVVANAFVGKSPSKQIPIERKKISMINSPLRTDIVSKERYKGTYAILFPCENVSKQDEIKILALKKLFKDRFFELPFFKFEYGKNGTLSFDNIRLDDINPNEKLAQLSQMVREIALKPPTNSEIEEIKKDLKKDIEDRYCGSNLDKLEKILLNGFGSNSYSSMSDEIKMVDFLTPNDIVDALKYINFNRMSLQIVHPKGTTNEKIVEDAKAQPAIMQPVIIPASYQYKNYNFVQNFDQLSGEKFLTTTLQNGTKLILVDSDKDDCEVSWRMYCGDDYSSNPAVKYVLARLYSPDSFLGLTSYDIQDSIEVKTSFEIDKLQDEINKLKNFNCFEFNQKDFDEAKKEALLDVEDYSNNPYDLYLEMVCGKKYSKDIKKIKQQLNTLSINDVINNLNNMILNSSSSVVVRAPISKNPQLANNIANSFDSSNFAFKQFDSYQNTPERNVPQCDCLIKVDDLNQNYISQNYQFKVTGNYKDYLIFELLARILSSKNFEKIRETQGLAYSSNVSYLDSYGIGSINLTTNSSCANANDVKAIYDSYKQNINEVLEGNISQDELIFAKNKLIGTLCGYFEDDNSELNAYMHDLALMPNGIESLNIASNILETLTVNDIKTAAQYIFRNKPKYLINASQRVVDENMKLFESFGKVEKR